VTAAEALPQPQAIDAAVFVDAIERTLTARLRDTAGGYERRLWTEAWQALRRAEAAGWPVDGAGEVWADLPGARQVTRGRPGEAATLTFRFPPGARGFADLISRPRVAAILTVDRSSHRFLTCRFLNRSAER
jgi:hypothetical protein